MAAATQVMIEAAAHAELRSCEEHRRWKAGCQHDGDAEMKLSERLEALLTRMTNGHVIALQCMEFIRDHGPALAELARSVEDAEIAEPAMQSGRLVSVIVREGAHYKGQRLRLVPEAGQEVGNG